MAPSSRRSSQAAPRRGHAASPRGAGLTAMFEALEARLPMAANIGASLWRITGDQVKGNFDDTIVVDRDPANAAMLRATVNGTVVSTRREAAVRVIHVFGGRGDDTITIDMLEPGVLMAFGKDEEQPLGLDRGAGFERFGETAWP